MLLVIIVLTLIATLLGASGALLLKMAGPSLSLNPLKLLRNYALVGGLGLYVIASIIFVYALKFGELSMIYPLTSLSYVWVTLLSRRLLKEPITRAKWGGILLIIMGVVLITL